MFAQLHNGARQCIEEIAEEQMIGGRYAIGVRGNVAVEHVDLAVPAAAPQVIVGAAVAEAEFQHMAGQPRDPMHRLVQYGTLRLQPPDERIEPAHSDVMLSVIMILPQILPEKASIETSTICNHTCEYCPVSEFPVAHQVMDMKLFGHVMSELAGLGRKLKRISYNHYNEPLVDPHLVDRVRLSLGYDFFRKILLNTNLSILPKKLPQELQFARDRLEFNVNLPTTDAGRYHQLHGKDHYRRVEANMDRLAEAGFTLKINIQDNSFVSRADREGVIARFGKSVHVETIESTSRGGLVEAVIRPFIRKEHAVLAGCLQDRPTAYVHVGVAGEVFLCCQDYFKKDQLGDLTRQTLREILDSEQARKYLEYVYGGRESPADFICNRCELAVYRDGSATGAAAALVTQTADNR
jgi:sulfatase maturation enzyme AslB (radical SAM superfamily)